MKANKKMYPGGGMLRNKYNNGGPVSGYGMSNRQMQGALMSRPSQPTPKKVVSTATKPAPATKPASMAKRPAPATAKPASMVNPLTLSGAPAYTRPAKPYLSSRGRPMSEKVAGAPKYKGVEVSLTSSNPRCNRSSDSNSNISSIVPFDSNSNMGKINSCLPGIGTLS